MSLEKEQPLSELFEKFMKQKLEKENNQYMYITYNKPGGCMTDNEELKTKTKYSEKTLKKDLLSGIKYYQQTLSDISNKVDGLTKQTDHFLSANIALDNKNTQLKILLTINVSLLLVVSSVLIYVSM